MARIWKEKHTGAVQAEYGEPFDAIERRADNPRLLPHDDIMVRVASFTFRFATVEQLRDSLAYYNEKTHASSLIPEKKIVKELGQDWRAQRSWEIERWYERLPMYLLEEPKRRKVVKALSKALELVKAGQL
jgi:hypothetical protein